MLLGASNAWSERNGNPAVHPPGSNPYGASYPEWAADWAEWIFSIPEAQSPFLDPDGRYCQVGQSPPVFLLGNNFGGESVRNCSVRPGQSVLFSPGGSLCLLHFDAETEEGLRACVEEALTHFTNVSADIDGKQLSALEKYRVISGLFDFTLPDGNIFGLPPGQYQAVIGGYFLMHTPLSVGRHVIHFHDELPEVGFVSDVTYMLSVGPHN
jgi:hypothetical protein